jgi:hypothetical protein
MLALHAHSLGKSGLSQPQRLHELFEHYFADRSRLALRHQYGFASLHL